MLFCTTKRFEVYRTRDESGFDRYVAVGPGGDAAEVFCTAVIDQEGEGLGPYVQSACTHCEHLQKGIATELLLAISERIGGLDLEAASHEGAALIRAYRRCWAAMQNTGDEG